MIYLPPPCFNEEEILEWDVHIMYGLLTKHKIKMAGLILAKFFFFCVFMDHDRVEVHINMQKKNKANMQPSWPNKLGQ